MAYTIEELQSHFCSFWHTKPKRDGENPRFKAFKSFCRAVKEGASPESIVAAAQKWALAMDEKKKTNTEYVPMASTWLNQKRFEEYETVVKDTSEQDAFMASKGLKWDGTKWTGTPSTPISMQKN